MCGVINVGSRSLTVIFMRGKKVSRSVRAVVYNKSNPFWVSSDCKTSSHLCYYKYEMKGGLHIGWVYVNGTRVVFLSYVDYELHVCHIFCNYGSSIELPKHRQNTISQSISKYLSHKKRIKFLKAANLIL